MEMGVPPAALIRTRGDSAAAMQAPIGGRGACTRRIRRLPSGNLAAFTCFPDLCDHIPSTCHRDGRYGIRYSGAVKNKPMTNLGAAGVC